MSALGQKQTYAVQKGMSALPPKADIDGLERPAQRFAGEHVAVVQQVPMVVTCTRACRNFDAILASR